MMIWLLCVPIIVVQDFVTHSPAQLLRMYRKKSPFEKWHKQILFGSFLFFFLFDWKYWMSLTPVPQIQGAAAAAENELILHELDERVVQQCNMLAKEWKKKKEKLQST